ncbi:carbonic anhydrase-related protein 11-like isoform X3 [Scyliorhinus torazame]|uniref:carbonic anhydrase-related protein 11-like isoform X3 n=1 Tax=Scyliorhinus torazame TaxID=75743 RepID=UPI003B5B7A6C
MVMVTIAAVLLLSCVSVPPSGGVSISRSYDDWWSYKETLGGDFIPSPPFWGLVNKAWRMCAIGRRQSPIDLNGSSIIFDPFLKPLRLSSGVNEVQLLHYNVNLYQNVSEASQYANGLMIISLFVEIDEIPNPFLNRMLSREMITRISYKNDAYFLWGLQLDHIFPGSFGFITYSGSMTTPPCHETVTWIILDRHITVNSVQMHSLRLLSQHEPSAVFHSMSDNYRLIQPLNNRSLRTSVDPHRQARKCPPTTQQPDIQIQANPKAQA